MAGGTGQREGAPMLSVMIAAAMFAAAFWSMTRNDHEFGSAG